MSFPCKGLMLYCFKNKVGCLVISDNIPENIFGMFKGYEWEDVGTFSINENNFISFYPSESSNPWENEDFLKNIYDENMNKILLSKKNGIILKCFESDETSFLLSDKIPIKGLSTLCNNKCSCCQWEDIGTFHVERNKIVYHDLSPISNGEIYDANLRKIHIHSY